MRVNVKHALGFFATGAAAGAVLGLLFAPKSGDKTRKDIRRLSRDAVDRLDDLQSDIRNQVGNIAEDVNEMVRDGIRAGKKLTAQIVERKL